MRLFDKLFNSIPTSVLNAIAIISGIITIITAIPSLHTILIEIIKGTLSFSAIISNIRILPFVLAVLCTYFLSRAVKNRKMQDEILLSFSESYYDLLHGYKNVLLKTGTTNPENDSDFIDLHSFAINVLDNLCSLLKTLTRQEVSACIKIIEPNDNLHFDNAMVSTFCRSTNSNPERFAHDNRASIKDNTIFSDIVSPGHCQGFFYKCDLEAYDRALKKAGKQFMNTNERWRDFYKSTMIVPIRILNTKIPDKTGQKSYTIFGFLAIDSISKKAFLLSKQAYYTSIVKAYADALAVILWNYKILIDKYSS